MEGRAAKVCVTGGSGYIASWLVKKLLLRGYVVHTTLRNLDDRSKVDLLRSLPNGDTNLVLFQADILNPAGFEPAIQGCESVFHVAHPTDTKAQIEGLIDTAVAGAKSIADACIRSGSVRRLIYTGSVVAMSPLNEDGVGYRPGIEDESSWTPPDVVLTHCNNHLRAYTKSKTLAEKVLLKYNDIENSRLEVVSLVGAVVAGETILPSAPQRMRLLFAPLTRDAQDVFLLKFLQELLGVVPIIHIDDVCEAHIFCAERGSMKGRFLCSATSISIQEISAYFRESYPVLEIAEEFLQESSDSGVKFNNSRLTEMGFKYRFDMKRILDDTVQCGRRLGFLPGKTTP